MIKGFEEQTCELNDDEKKLIPMFIAGLQNKIGKELAISNKKIREKLKIHNISVSDARVRKIVNHIRINNLVSLLCSNSKGYYVAKSTEEIKDYLKGLKSRIDSQQHVYNSINKQYQNLTNAK